MTREPFNPPEALMFAQPMAFALWWDDKIVYRGYRWSELNRQGQGIFSRALFPQMRTNTKDEAEARTYYNAMNFGGVDHIEEERA